MDPAHRSVSRFLARVGVPRSDPLLAAVSGGADSLALLQILQGVGQRVGVAHVHHGLRGEEAERDLACVRERARQLGLAFHLARVEAGRRDGRSPEARARGLRYEALESLRAAGGYRAVVTGHTLDDQAETLLLRAARGSGPLGLAGIRSVARDGRLLRPLLELRRSDLRDYLRSRGIDWCEDGTNLDRRVPRNRLRAEVLPGLERVHRGASRKLAELAACAAGLVDWLDATLEAVLSDAVEPGDGGRWVRRAPLLALPDAARARALALVLREAGLGERVERVHLERLARFVERATPGKRLSLPAQHCLLAGREGLWLGPADGPRFPAPFREALVAPLPLLRPERDLRLVWQSGPGPGEGREPARALPVPLASATALVARSARPGDRIRAEGDHRERALNEWFVRARWSERERARAVVVTWRERVIWAVGLCRTATFATTAAAGWELRAERLSTLPEQC